MTPFRRNPSPFRRLLDHSEKVPLGVWLTLAVDMVGRSAPPQSALLKKLEELRSRDGDEKAVWQEAKALVEFVATFSDQYKAPEWEMQATEALNREVSDAITRVAKTHFVIRGLAIALGTLVAFLFGINFLHAKYVLEAKQAVEQMQNQLNGARLAIFDKQNDLNKVLIEARNDLSTKGRVSREGPRMLGSFSRLQPHGTLRYEIHER